MLLLLLHLLLTPVALGDEPAPALVWAQVEQEQLPDLAARELAAMARVSSREAALAGEGSLASAFPSLRAARLDQAAVVRGRLAGLDDRGAARAAEAAHPLPEGDDEQRATLREARDRALSAEARADELERHYLYEVLALHAADPGWGPGVQALRGPLESPVDPLDDPAAEARRAARVDADRVALDALVWEVHRAAVVGDDVQPPDGDMALLADPDRGGTAATRPDLVYPRLAPADAAAVSEALVAWWAERTEDPTPLPADAAGLVAVRDDLEVRLASTGDTPWEQARHSVLAERHARVVAALEALEHGSDVEAEADRAREDAAAARAQAERAREEAADAEALRTAELQERWATAQERAQAAWDAGEAQSVADAAVVAGVTDTLGTVRADVVRLDELPALDPSRPDGDATWEAIDGRVVELRHHALDAGASLARVRLAAREAGGVLAAEDAAIRTERSTWAEAPAEASLRAQADALTRWEEALGSEERAWSRRLEEAEAHRATVLVLLDQAKALRRDAEPHASRAARARTEARWPAELEAELVLLGPRSLAVARERLGGLVDVVRTGDLTGLWDLLVSFALLVLVAAGWLAARRVSGPLVHDILGRLPLQRSDLPSVREPAGRLVRAAVDLVAVAVFMPRVDTPELHLVLLVILQIAVFRALVAVFDLAVVPLPETRPALRVVSRPVWEQGRRTVRVLLLWFILRQFTSYLALNLLGADVLAALLRVAFGWALVGIVVGLLHRWEPVLRGRVARETAAHAVIRALAAGPPHWSLALAWSLGSLAFLAARGTVDAVYRLGREGSGVGWVLAMLGRYRMGKGADDEAHVEVLPDDVADKLVETCDAAELGLQEAAREALLGARDRWQRDGRRGMVAILVDRGLGADPLLDALLPELAGELPLLRAPVSRRLTTDDDALGWLAEALGAPGALATADDAVAWLDTVDSRVIVLERTHLAFLRSVGGFSALRTLLYVMNAAERHLWVTVLHRPAWAYLSRLSGLVDVGVFRAVVPLEGMGEGQLRTLALQRATVAGIDPDFSGLVRSTLLGGDDEVELERARTVFFRLLTEASGGSPAVALHLWRACLVPAGPARVRVRMSEAVALRALSDLSDTHLFVLAALRVLEELDTDELVRVTNMAPSVVRQAVKSMSSRGLVERAGARTRIVLDQLPAVTRALRRRHFLQWAG